MAGTSESKAERDSRLEHAKREGGDGIPGGGNVMREGLVELEMGE